MDVSTITIDQSEAAAKLREYAVLNADVRTDEDRLLLAAYQAAAGGDRLINVHAAFRQTGLNEHGQPRLAMARADWERCVFHPRRAIGGFDWRGAGLFTERRRIDPRLRVNCASLPARTFDNERLTREIIRSPIPHIPPGIRPRTSYLPRYWVLFEVEKWEQYPVDPFLLRHIGGPFYVIEAEWELTALEASLLSALVR